MGINTGTPGFDVDGKAYTYTVEDKNARDDLTPPPNADSGDIHVEQNDPPRKDVNKKAMKTIADYLGKKTSAVNAYPIDGVQAEPRTLLTDADGFVPPIPSQGAPTTNSNFFTKGTGNIAGTVDTSTQLKRWDVTFNAPNPASIDLRKGREAAKTNPLPNSSKGSVGKVDGNQLLTGAASGVDGKSPYVDSILRNNRFTADNKFAIDNGLGELRNDNPTFYSPKYLSEKGPMSANTLAQVGVSLSVRASRELNSAAADSSPNSGGSEAKAILPSFNQLGAERVDSILLEARDVIMNLAPAGDDYADNFVNISNNSWGSLNNSLDTYSGVTSFGMMALSTALTAAVSLLFEGLGFLFSVAKGSPQLRKSGDRFILGRSTVAKLADPNAFPPSLPPDISALLGLRPTIKPRGECLKAGTLAFFGIDESSGVLGAVTSGLASAVSAPGFNSVVSRSIVRSITVIIESLKKMFSSANLIAAVKNIMSMIDTLRTSKLISAINIFTMLGDAVLLEHPEYLSIDLGSTKKTSKIDALADNIPKSAVTKNRLGRGGADQKLKLAWASNRAPSLYLLPTETHNLQVASRDIGSYLAGYGLQEKDTRSYYKIDKAANGARIPTGKSEDKPDEMTLRNIERILEGSEYVPFYFHDVRTNEVVAFHAFLASLSDDYTANYESTDGFGRVEPVRIYKGTTRKIGMSFYIASTSKSDFSDMWVKINKLVTLVYPQYTEGRRLASPDSKVNFIQPFSQMVGASPLIRIRLGNLLRSNYSRFALARLFGATSSGVQFGDSGKLDMTSGSPQTLEDAHKKASSGDDTTSTFFVPPGMTLGLRTDGGGDVDGRPPYWDVTGHSQCLIVKITGRVKDREGAVYVKPEVPSADVLKQFSEAPSVFKQELQNRYDNKTNLRERFVGAEWEINVGSLIPTEETQKKWSSKDTKFAGYEDLTKFLDVEKNAIAKSFKSAGGKGLAGFIDSMNFDWYDRVTWDTDDPSTLAPMFCKVTISFTPVHDITPGIDSQGYNRAPVYPIGFMSHGEDKEKK